MYQWCEFKSRQGKNKNLTGHKSNSNTVWSNFQTYAYICVCVFYTVLAGTEMTNKKKYIYNLNKRRHKLVYHQYRDGLYGNNSMSHISGNHTELGAAILYCQDA